MNTAVINIKLEPKTKREAQKIVADLGLTLTGAVNGFLKQLIRTKTVAFSMREDNPSDYLLSSIEESKNDRRAGRVHSFKNSKSAIRFLDNR